MQATQFLVNTLFDLYLMVAIQEFALQFGRQEAADCAFAGSTFPNDTHDLSPMDIDRDPFERPENLTVRHWIGNG